MTQNPCPSVLWNNGIPSDIDIDQPAGHRRAGRVKRPMSQQVSAPRLPNTQLNIVPPAPRKCNGLPFMVDDIDAVGCDRGHPQGAVGVVRRVALSQANM
jgi:hypothetical protein